MRWRRAFGAGMVVLPLLVVLAIGFGQDPHAVPSVLEGKQVPDFKLTSLDGATVEGASLRSMPTVVNFWATWCYPCQAEHGLLREAAEFYAGRVRFLGVVYQDTAEDARRYLKEHPSGYPHLIDSNTTVAIDFGVAGVPESFIIDATGRITHKQAGVLTAKVLRRTLDDLLATSPAATAPEPKE